jgi:hypothetical protein
MLAPPAGAHDSPVLPEGDFTPEQVAEAEAKVHEVEEVLPMWADTAYAEEQGYFDFGVPTPNGYWHYINPSFFNDGHLLDPEFPESLVYKQMPDGSRKLEAAMFFLDFPTTMETIPEELEWWPGWHQHPELCTGPDGRFSGLTKPDGTCDRGEPGVGPPMIHVWIVDTECGHRFTGLGVGGNMCDPEGEHGHGPGGEEPPPGHGHPEPTVPPTTPPTTPPAPEPTEPNPPAGHPPMARPATPVTRQPTYTG